MEEERLLPRSTIRVFLEAVRGHFRVGILFGILSGIALAIQMISAKVLLESFSFEQIMFFRSVGMTVMIVSLSLDSSSRDGYDLAIYVAYGITNVVGISLSYVALKFTSVGNVNAVAMNLTIPTTFFAYVFLGETVTKYQVFLFVLNLTGIVLISIPNSNIFYLRDADTEPLHFVGVSIAFASLMSMTLSRIVARKSSLRGSMDPSLMTVMSGMVGMPFCLLISISGSLWAIPTTITEWGCLLVCVLSSIGANQFAMTGLKYEPANNISILNSISVPMSYIVGVLLFAEIPTVTHMWGALLILGSTVGSYFQM